MSWDKESLFSKSKVFFEKAFAEDRGSDFFGLWCAMGLELLARATLASVSPALLAEPDREHKYLLQALNKGNLRTPPKSIGAAQVFALCGTLFDTFTESHSKIAIALINRRNEELHSGSSAFSEYPNSKWLLGFYQVCDSLVRVMNETLESAFGAAEAQNAQEFITEGKKEVKAQVLALIAAHLKVFEGKAADEREELKEKAEYEASSLAFRLHHCVNCPACGSKATVQGVEFGNDRIVNMQHEIQVKVNVSPRSFACIACGLKLNGYAELQVAELGGNYTRTVTYSPENFYGLSADRDYWGEDHKPDAGYWDNE